MKQKIIQLRSKLLVFLTHQLALPLLKLIRKPEVFPYTREALHAMKPGTLGKDLALMLDDHQFELLTHYAKHDMKHILLSYPATDKGEVCLQAFMLGNGRISFPVISTLLFGFITMPEYWSAFMKAFKRGRRANPISHWHWQAIVTEETRQLQLQIFTT